MAKYNVKMSCGHEETVELFGPTRDRDRRIKNYEENGTCSACYDKKQAEGKIEKEMHYGEYKEHYSHCKTKKDSYNSDTKTIVVYIDDAAEKKAATEKELSDKAKSIVDECLPGLRLDNPYALAKEILKKSPPEVIINMLKAFLAEKKTEADWIEIYPDETRCFSEWVHQNKPTLDKQKDLNKRLTLAEVKDILR